MPWPFYLYTVQYTYMYCTIIGTWVTEISHLFRKLSVSLNSPIGSMLMKKLITYCHWREISRFNCIKITAMYTGII